MKREIQVLEETLDKLGELYGGIECFSSHHCQSLQERREKIQESTLYIGLFSDNCSLLDRQTEKPFMELEYEAVKTKNIPYLLYFKQSQLSHQKTAQETIQLNYEVFKNRVIENEFFKSFETINKLEQEFVIDFIKLLRRTLFNKVDINQQNSFSLETLHLLCRASIREQIKAVGRDKYIADIYIERGVEKEIKSFVKFGETFLEQSNKILNDLTQISQNYRLRNEVYYYLPKAKAILRNSQTLEQYSQLINELKKAFYYEEVETIVNLINLTVRSPIERNIQYDDNLKTINSLFKKLPFVNEQALSELPRKLFKACREQVSVGEPSLNLIEILKIFPSKFYDQEKTSKLANDLIKYLNELVQLQVQKCIALVSNAGYGKTNIICHLADSLSRIYPVVLLSGQMEITGQYNIESHIQQQLESFLAGSFLNWSNRIKSVSDNTNGQWLFILIDGVNENSNLPLFIRLLREFIEKIDDKRIKLVITCRNLFWDLFSATLKNNLFENKIIELYEFNEQERKQAIQLYFERFNIQSSFDISNISSLQNPLLLRFLCEAHRDLKLDKVSSIELLSVFDLYVKRVEEKINEQFGFLGTNQIITFLTKLGSQMWRRRKLSLSLSELEITPKEASKSTSVYNLVRSENLIFEESLQAYATQKSIRFLYDEFMEYVIARSWLEQLVASQELEKAIEILIQEAVTALSNFSPAFGAIIVLDKMLKRNGELINRTISLLAASEDEFVASRQIVMLAAFEKIDIHSVSDELIIALDKFERIARDEIKEKLAPIIIQVLRQNSNHPVTKEMISRILEVSNDKTIITEDEKNELEDIREKLNVDSLDKTTLKENKSELLRLPPGRYHYKEEIKLNAISLLVISKNAQDFALIEESINSLGKMELYSALTALTSLDLADDELLYRMLAKYYEAYLSEYRIYCAWLLRNRYGKQPSEYLTGLLMDKETRVHRYTLNLFEKRRIEKELIISLLAVIQQIATIKPWHLINLIKIFGKRHQFYSQDIIHSYGHLIISTLMDLRTHSQSSLRLEAYKSLMQYDELIERKIIISSMEKDKDIYVRKLAEMQKNKK